MNNVIASLMSLAGPDLIIGILVSLALFGFWLWMLLDCSKKEPRGTTRTIWLFVIVLVPFGAVVYLLARKLWRSN